MNKPSPLLEKKIWSYAFKLKQKKDGSRYVSGAEYRLCRKVAKSGDHLNGIVKELENELEEFGAIGSKLNGSSIGYCAEAVAVNRVLELNIKKLSEIIVGSAIRVKTLQYRKKCKICRKMFK